MAARQRVTIRDVAQAAGVSITTVSDALSGNGRLPAATRSRVAAVAGRLGYQANPAARSLRGRRVGSIGLYLPDDAGSYAYYLALAGGAASEALAHGLALTLIPQCPDPARVTAFPVDGFCAVDPVRGDPVVRAFSRLGIPVVTCERDLTPGAEHTGRVEGDYRPVMTSLLDHLADQGAERVALIAPGPETAWGLDQRTAYRDWCTAGRRPEALYDVPFPASPEQVRDATLRALRSGPAPDAVVSGTDGGALGALVAAAELSRRVPEDLLVASSVDSPALRSCSPAITALDLRPDDMGRRLAALLHALLDGTAPAGTVQVVHPRLVIRASTTR
jgi:DNA-binding LacI/PurR family transcriptional regulator